MTMQSGFRRVRGWRPGGRGRGGRTGLGGARDTNLETAPAPGWPRRATRRTKAVAAWLAICAGLPPALLSAEQGSHRSASPPATASGSVAGWTAAGAGAGFGLGLYAGLRAFDDAVNSDRKVWTAAIVAGAAGAFVGYLVGRARQSDHSRGRAAIGSTFRGRGAQGVGGAGGVVPGAAAVWPEAAPVRFHLRHVGVGELVREDVTRGGEAGGGAPRR